MFGVVLKSKLLPKVDSDPAAAGGSDKITILNTPFEAISYLQTILETIRKPPW